MPPNPTRLLKMMKNRYKFLKALNEYKSADYELKYMLEVLKDAHIEFEVFYRQWCAENDVDIKKLNEQNKKKVETMFNNQEVGLEKVEKKEEKEERDFGHVFKDIARKLHPDKLDRLDPRKAQYEYDFKRATSAKDKGDWGVLFEIIEKYGMPMAGYDEATQALEEHTKRITKEIDQQKHSYSWKMTQCKTEECKASLVKSFLKQVFGWKQ